MSSLSKRYAETLAQLKALEAKEQIEVVMHSSQFCPICKKDVPVTIRTTLKAAVIAVTCESCGADLTEPQLKEPQV